MCEPAGGPMSIIQSVPAGAGRARPGPTVRRNQYAGRGRGREHGRRAAHGGAGLDLRKHRRVLTAVGLYGLLAYVVAQRRREIGIRMALGAQTVDIGVLVERQALAMVIGGLGLWGLVRRWRRLSGCVRCSTALRRRIQIARCRRHICGIRGRCRDSHPRRRATNTEPAAALRREN